MTSPASARELAAAQIDLAIREAQAPVEALGLAIANLSACARHADRPEIDREISACVESLQFFDRLTQHLSHVRDLLIDGSADRTVQDPSLWQERCRQIRSRLISQAQRDLFDLLVGPCPTPVAADEAGSIELF